MRFNDTPTAQVSRSSAGSKSTKLPQEVVALYLQAC
jgi:hypothetical protein